MYNLKDESYMKQLFEQNEYCFYVDKEGNDLLYKVLQYNKIGYSYRKDGTPLQYKVQCILPDRSKKQRKIFDCTEDKLKKLWANVNDTVVLVVSGGYSEPRGMQFRVISFSTQLAPPNGIENAWAVVGDKTERFPKNKLHTMVELSSFGYVVQTDLKISFVDFSNHFDLL